MTDVRRYTAHNRLRWNEVAEARRANCPPPEFFARGGFTLGPEETAAMGPVTGKRLLNLLCSSGNEALSWAAMGASVTGVDISDVAIAIAREQAAGAGLGVTFIASDVYDLPTDLQRAGFDIVYSTAGVICWLPDLAEWGRIVARALKPGGRFVLDEHHPLWETVKAGPRGYQVDGDYFGRRQPDHANALDPVRAAHAGSRTVRLDGITFTWPLGDVVTALADAGLRIQKLAERPATEMYLPAPEDRTEEAVHAARRLPAAYLLVAVKDVEGLR